MMRKIRKEIFLDALACPTLGWLLRNEEIEQIPLTLGEEFRIEQGTKIGRRVREFFSDGVLVDEKTWRGSLELMKRCRLPRSSRISRWAGSRS